MVNRGGLQDWLIQRTSALLIGAYAVFLSIYWVFHNPLNYVVWHTLFGNKWMKIATLVVTISIVWHAWIGLWTIFTDYITNKAFRFFIESILLAVLLCYILWVILILWF